MRGVQSVKETNKELLRSKERSRRTPLSVSTRFPTELSALRIANDLNARYTLLWVT